MKKLLLLVAPIGVGIFVFFIFLFFYSQQNKGNGALQITSVPVSNVYVNDKLVGKTPLCLCEGKQLLPSGIYNIKVTPLAGDNLQAYNDSVVITKGTLTVVDRTFGSGSFSSGSVISLIPLSDQSESQLYVLSLPSGANVSVDGNGQGITPLFLKSLISSDHDITLTKPGYADKTVHVHTVTGYQLKAIITLGLSQSNATSSASLSASLQNASLTPAQQIKITILDTPTGFLRVRADPSVSASETAQVKPGDSFTYIDEQNGWYEIVLPNGANGWVSSQYAEKQ